MRGHLLLQDINLQVPTIKCDNMKVKTYKRKGLTVRIEMHKDYDDYIITGSPRDVNFVVERLNAYDWMSRTIPSLKK